MKNKQFDILDFKKEDEILEILNQISQKPLTETSHLYTMNRVLSIKEAAEESASNYSEKAKEKPAIALLSVVLAANRNYNKVVKPNIERIEETGLANFDQLKEILKNKSQIEFYKFWGHKDEKKYKTLVDLLHATDILKKQNPTVSSDYELLNLWGKNANLLDRENDIIGKIPNIAIATFQHIRMAFGIDTVKPDQRVKEVLDYEFGIPKLNDENAIEAVEQIAKIAKIKVITLDQIFVNYGSGYYNQATNKLSVKEIAGKLKTLGVDKQIISEATLLTFEQIKRL